MVEILRPAMAGKSLDFSAVNQANAQSFKGRNAQPADAGGGSNRGEKSFNANANRNKVSKSINDANSRVNNQRASHKGGSVQAGFFEEIPNQGVQQARLNKTLDQGK